MIANFTRTVITILVISVLLVACNSSTNGTPAIPTPVSTELPTESPSPTETTPPTVTSQPPLVLLIVSPDIDSAQIDELQSTLSELSDTQGYQFQVRPTLTTDELTQDVSIVVVLPPDPGLTDLAASAPQTQFVGINIPGIETTGNISAIGPEGASPDQLGFLAGYIAAVITTDWRVGTISTSDSAAGTGSRNGFLNGAVFFCGLCNPAYPPFYDYPMYGELHSGATAAEWQIVADMVKDNFVETVYVPAFVEGNELLTNLTGSGINIIGGITPPESIRQNWVATVYPDASDALQQIWPDLVAGSGGFHLPLSLKLSNLNTNLFSPGRQRLADQIRLDLQNGFIDTGVDPLTGKIK